MKSFTFTINNYTEDHKKRLEDLKEVANVLYAALERGEQGTPHIQGFITFKKDKRFTGVHKLLPGAHVEQAKGAKSDNYSYIILGLNRDGTPKEHNEVFIDHDITHPGDRTDLKKILATAKEHGIKRTARDHPVEYARYFKGIAAYVAATAEPRTEYPSVYWLYGPTGIGKTEFAFNKTDVDDVYIANMAPSWYDGLDNHNWIVFDEFDKQPFPLRELLMILDRYPYRAPIKGGSVNFNPKNIVITSSTHPENLYNGTDWDQVYRRLTFIASRPTYADPWNWEKAPQDFDVDEYTNE